MSLGRILAERGKYDEAEQLGLRALAIYEAQPAPQQSNVQAPLRFLAGLYRAQGRDEEAAAAARRMIESAQESVQQATVRFGEDHPAVAGAISRLARVYSEVGQIDQAEKQLLRSLEIYQSSFEAYPEVSMHYSGALRQMAQLYRAQGREEASREMLSRAESLFSSTLHYERSPTGH